MADISELGQKIEDGYRLQQDEAVSISNETPLDELCKLADGLRQRFHGTSFDTCSIMNARSGRCSEDCKWCSQSKFHATDVPVYPLVGAEEALEAALYNESKGVRRFSLVTSGRTMSDLEVEAACKIYKNIGQNTNIALCGSMGLLNQVQLGKLHESGVTRYHCNLESAPSYFPTLCTTHTTQQKIETLLSAKAVGMEVCSGGIIGMGETNEQRIELAVTLQQIGVESIPINILNPIPGTKLENTPPLGDEQILRTVAMMRIVNPNSHIRLAGGRGIISHLMPRLLRSGVSALITGDMLTTTGSQIDSDKNMLKNAGYDI